MSLSTTQNASRKLWRIYRHDPALFYIMLPVILTLIECYRIVYAWRNRHFTKQMLVIHTMLQNVEEKGEWKL